AILLPGAMLVYLVQPWTLPLVPPALVPRDGPRSWAVFFVCGYVVGHLLHEATGRLDRYIYDGFYLATWQEDHSRAVKAIKDIDLHRQNDEVRSTLVARAYVRARGMNTGTSLYNWCLSFVRLKNAAAVAEVDRLQADSKFFRSLMLV